MLTTVPGTWMRGAVQRAESSAGHGDGSPNPPGPAQSNSNYLWCTGHLPRWVGHKSYCHPAETACFISPHNTRSLGEVGGNIWFFFSFNAPLDLAASGRRVRGRSLSNHFTKPLAPTKYPPLLTNGISRLSQLRFFSIPVKWFCSWCLVPVAKGCRTTQKISEMQPGDAAQHSFLSIFLGKAIGAVSKWPAGNLVVLLLSTDPSMSLAMLSIPPRAPLSFCFIKLQYICHACSLTPEIQCLAPLICELSMPSVNPYNTSKLPPSLLLLALFLNSRGFNFLSKTFQSPNNLHKDCLHFLRGENSGTGWCWPARRSPRMPRDPRCLWSKRRTRCPRNKRWGPKSQRWTLWYEMAFLLWDRGSKLRLEQWLPWHWLLWAAVESNRSGKHPI